MPVCGQQADAALRRMLFAGRDQRFGAPSQVATELIAANESCVDDGTPTESSRCEGAA
jgi:hypothetical protein